jgi:hypothetical protein
MMKESRLNAGPRRRVEGGNTENQYRIGVGKQRYLEAETGVSRGMK